MEFRVADALRVGAALAVGSLGFIGVASGAGAEAITVTMPLHVTPVLVGSNLSHTFTPVLTTAPLNVGTPQVPTTRSAPLTNIDDLTQLGSDFFVVFQNGVGPNGEVSATGNADSTVVEFTASGHVLGQWDVAGRTDGLVADPQRGGVIVTVNEDSNSSLFVIEPAAPSAQQVTHYVYGAPLAHGGGTDSLAIVDGQLLITASNPGTSSLSAPNATFPAVYVASLNAATQVASLSPFFSDEDVASVANGGSGYGAKVNLALTDPDSSVVVPRAASRFAGDFELTSQGDQQEIFVSRPGTAHQKLSVLSLTQSVDDTAYATDHDGSLMATDAASNSVDVITGWLSTSLAYAVATPCSANSATSSCAANFLGTLNLWNGTVTPVATTGAAFAPKGALIFVGDDASRSTVEHSRH